MKTARRIDPYARFRVEPDGSILVLPGAPNQDAQTAPSADSTDPYDLIDMRVN
ncbi:hypothetical protein ACFMBG_07155 [Leisingera sp. D0M16]|uniref:hypothetical protein n=1 Tax=Leisingera coralii TaxID=3351347 RepID=UPI003B809C9D